MRLTYRFCDDWLIYAQAEDGSWWYTITETWPEWLDGDVPFGIDNQPGMVAEYMLPKVTGWDTEESPTGSIVSAPRRLGVARWEAVPGEHWADLEKHPKEDAHA